MMHAFVDGSPRRGSPERTLEKLCIEFIKLQRVRAEIKSDFGVDDHADANCELIDKVFAPIDGELRDLATRAATIAANGNDDMAYKAVMLGEFLRSNDHSIYVALASSLVADIKGGACDCATTV